MVGRAGVTLEQYLYPSIVISPHVHFVIDEISQRANQIRLIRQQHLSSLHFFFPSTLAAVAVQTGEFQLPPLRKSETRCSCYWDSQESSAAVLLTICSIAKPPSIQNIAMYCKIHLLFEILCSIFWAWTMFFNAVESVKMKTWGLPDLIRNLLVTKL